VLVGTGNPEEGELRPQLLDRFGLSVEVKTPDDLPTRIEVIKRRDAFETDPPGFVAQWAKEEAKSRKKIVSARDRLDGVTVPDEMLAKAAQLCMALGTDGLRGELTLMRAARATAAIEGARSINTEHLKRVAPASLRHRLRRNALDDSGSSVRVERAIAECFAL
jgi:magnesium chelatase subunit I